MSILRLFSRCAVAIAIATIFVSTKVRAEIVILNVDPVLSSLTLSGSAFGLTYLQQNPGALTANYSGTITGDLTGGVFTFTGGSSVAANINPSGPFTVAPNPIGTESGNYGVTASGVVIGIGDAFINGVYKNLVIDITAGTAANNVTFSGATLNFTAGVLDFGAANTANPSVPIAGGTSNLVNVNGSNTSAALASWNGTTLTLPVVFQTIGSNRIENWSGTIVANVVPEPSSTSLLTLVSLFGCFRSRSRRGVCKL